MPLSDAACKNLKPAESPYKKSDGEGLFLFVQPGGSKLWRMAYRFDGKQKTLSFGIYPYVSLADARQKRTDAKRALAAGRDPGVKAETGETFESMARRWFDNEKGEWAESHSGRLLARLERDAFPQIGHKPLGTIRPPEVIEMLRKVEARGAIEVAKRLKQSISSVYRFAIAEGLVENDPAAHVGDALKPTPKTRHFATIRPEDTGELVENIKAYDGEHMTRIALLFALHTFVRTAELRFATWDEIDGETWRIPKERMKMGREHLVPLSPDALALLKEAEAYRDGRFIFSSRRGRPMSENTMLYALYRMGYHSRLTVHGFRRLASTVLNEQGFNGDHIERQLAHVEDNKIRGIYNSAEWMPARRQMMAWWSGFVEGREHLAK